MALTPQETELLARLAASMEGRALFNRIETLSQSYTKIVRDSDNTVRIAKASGALQALETLKTDILNAKESVSRP
jgi:hypothetical protein